jgi:hypothetical protein
MPVHTAARIGPLLFSALFLGLSAAQLVGGIGALMLRPWARALLRIAAIGALTLLILGLVGSIFSLIAVLSGGEVGMISIAVLIPLVLVIAGLVYNGLVLWWFNTPTARAEFQVDGAAPAPAVSSTICPSCSKVNHSSAQFCYHCGQALTWDKPAAEE